MLRVHFVADAFVGLVYVGCAVVPHGLGAALHQLVEATHLDAELAEEGDEAVEAVVCRARTKLHHLILIILFLLDL